MKSQYQNYLKRQQNRLNAVRAVRSDLIRGPNTSRSPSSLKPVISYTAPIDRDKAQLAILQRKKAAEVQAKRDYEQKALAKAKRDSEKMAAENERDRRLKEQKDQAKRNWERQQKDLSDARKLKLEEDLADRKKQLAREYEEQKQRLRYKQEWQLEKERKAFQRKQEIADRHQQFKRATQNILADQQNRIQEKKKKLDARSFSKSKHIEKEAFLQTMDIERKGHNKVNHVNNVLGADRSIQKEKQDKYLSWQDQAAQRKSANDAAKYSAMQAKRLADELKQKQREKTKSLADDILASKTNNIVEYHNAVQVKLKVKADFNTVMAESKAKAAYLRQREIEDAIKRGQAKADFKRQQTLQKLQAKDKRLEDLKAERERIAAEKIRVRDAVESKKQEIIQDYARKKTMYDTANSGFSNDKRSKSQLGNVSNGSGFTSPRTNNKFGTVPANNDIDFENRQNKRFETDVSPSPLAN